MNAHPKIELAGPAVAPTAAPSTGTGGQRDSAPGQRAAAASRYRLVIEEGPSAGTFVYKTLDRETGEVVRQLPRESVISLMSSPDYGSGRVFDTKA